MDVQLSESAMDLTLRRVLVQLGSGGPLEQVNAEDHLRRLGPDIDMRLEAMAGADRINIWSTLIGWASSVVGYGSILGWLMNQLHKFPRQAGLIALAAAVVVLVAVYLFRLYKHRAGALNRGMVRAVKMLDPPRGAHILLLMVAKDALPDEGVPVLAEQLERKPPEPGTLTDKEVEGLVGAAGASGYVDLQVKAIRALRDAQVLEGLPVVKGLARTKTQTVDGLRIQEEAQRTLRELEELEEHS